MNPYALLFIGIAWAGSIAVTGSFAYRAGEDSVTAFNAKAEKVMQETREIAQQGAAAAIAANRPKNTTIVNEVQREIKTETRFVDCRNTAGSLRGINAALTGKQPEPAGGFKLPGTVATP